MTRTEEINQQLAIIEAQLQHTKIDVLIKNCNRTRNILLKELEEIRSRKTLSE